ncbi:MAG: SDR family NAD(P)-dependent oxidoreductase [Flavobacterium sp.]|uniref:SDR family NAD(P)-dependent oxidoreductase n=1 Tax=Flavobacterium sp. TaxID=239 RepID=UPI0025C70A73|nr:SDR family NAD(P)-dependent oxidoreductase [Flavobacterium sp.]MCK6608690.1 SDR family NAD(P)-dependent oxidoreductase [Flavobacterium sp.]
MSKVVLITGGSSGIGKSIGEFLHQKGFVVYGTSRNPEKITNSIFSLVALDVRDKQSIVNCVAEVIQKSGRLDIVINNAGVGITGPIEEIPTEEIRNNLPYRGIYSASKGALELITEALRMEVKSFGIQITNVAPGDFATNIAAGRYHAPVVKGSAYEVPYGNTLKEMDSHVDSGSNPNEMAEAIFAIIKTDKPKVHYKVGAFMQKFSIVLKRILPDTIYEKMLMNHYKL